MKAILEFFEKGRKVAECPPEEVYELPKDVYMGFWWVQDLLGRSARLTIPKYAE